MQQVVHTYHVFLQHQKKLAALEMVHLVRSETMYHMHLLPRSEICQEVEWKLLGLGQSWYNPYSY